MYSIKPVKKHYNYNLCMEYVIDDVRMLNFVYWNAPIWLGYVLFPFGI